MNFMFLVMCFWYIFAERILQCRALTFRHGTYMKLESPRNLLAMVLENTEEDSASGCLVKCYTDRECTGVKVQRQGTSWNCSFVSTDVARLTENTRPFLRKASSFDLYCSLKNLNKGQAGCVQRSPDYATWPFAPWTTKEDYLKYGRLSGIRVWYGLPSVNFIHGIQMRFGDVWTSVKGNDIGSVGEIVLSGNETITHVHYWVYLSKTNAIEFKSSEGAVYGPWGATSDQEITIQMKELLWISGGSADLWTPGRTFRVIRPISFFFTMN